MKYLLLPFILLLISCSTVPTDVMVQTTTITSGTSFLDRTNELIDVATECWTSEAYTQYYGTEIEKDISEESATIIAKLKTETSSKPILKIIIHPHENGSKASVYERERPFITKGNYEDDVIRWLNGLYSCM